MTARTLLVLGTASDVGKSTVVTATAKIPCGSMYRRNALSIAAGASSGSRSLAMPKSSSLGRRRPARDTTMMFWGLMSRWTMPCSCAV